MSIRSITSLALKPSILLPRTSATPLVSVSSSSSSTSTSSISPSSAVTTIHRLQQVRHEASARRHTKKLRLHPHSSFKSPTNPSAPGDLLPPSQTHIIYNPPSAAPSVYNTPKAFLPQNDPRLSIPSLSPPEPTSRPTVNNLLSTTPPIRKKLGSDGLPPPLSTPYEKKYNVTPKQVETMRRLRLENPEYWTRDRLAEKYNCSQFFVGMVAPVTKERAESEFAKIEEVKKRWGKKRIDARKERARRREAWSKDLY